jgi:hypothetical protein
VGVGKRIERKRKKKPTPLLKKSLYTEERFIPK